MSDKEIIDKWVDSHDGEDFCKYCMYSEECPKGIVCYGGEPIEPYCCGRNYEDYLDTESLLEDIKDDTDDER